MSMDQLDVIDLLSTDTTGRLVLTILDDLDWSDEPAHRDALNAKLGMYLDVVESGQVDELASQVAGSDVPAGTPIRIDLVVPQPWPALADRYLTYARGEVASLGAVLTFRIVAPPAPADTPPDRAFCDRAIAYLKVELVGSAPTDLQLDDDDAPVLHDLGNGLLVAYLVDQGQSYSYVQGRHLHGAGLDAHALHAIALSNLARHAQEHARVESYAGIFAALAGGDFEASYLLLDELWEGAWGDLVPGRLGAVIPCRDVLVFGDLDSPAAVAELHAVVARGQAGEVDHPLILDLLTRVDGRWRRASELA